MMQAHDANDAGASERARASPAVDLSIIIVNYRATAYLERCLATLAPAAGGLAYEVIIVDNTTPHGGDGGASADGAGLDAIAARHPDIQMVRNSYNWGFAIANNQGYRRSRGRYVAPLNPDTELAPGALVELVRLLDADPGCGLAAPVLVGDDGRCQAPPHQLTRLDRPAAWTVLRRGRATPPLPSLPYAVDWVWGTGYLLRRAALTADELFPERHFLFGEEYDLCRGLKRAGYRLMVVPAARVRHHTSVTWNRRTESRMMAYRLMQAVRWETRRREFGSAVATLDQVLRLGDATAMWLAASALARLGRTAQPAYYRTLAGHALELLRRGDDFVGELDRAARRYFNDGRDPPSPPPR